MTTGDESSDSGEANPPEADALTSDLESLLPDITFDGGRFVGVGFPLDAIQELHKYQRLVVEVAKQLWQEQNPGKRLPENIADQVRLRLTGVRPGSVKVDFSSETTLSFPGLPTLRDQSMDYVNSVLAEIIAKNFRTLLKATPGTVTGFRGLASGLNSDEVMKVRPERPDQVVFSLDDHRALLVALRGRRFERTGTLVGVLDNLSSVNKFALIDGQNRSIEGAFSDATVWDALHTLHSRRAIADLIWIDCDYTINEDGSVAKITEVRDANLFADSKDRWARKLAKFAALPEGRHEGLGIRVEIGPIEAALQILTSVSQASWLEPAVFSSLEGGVRMEWTRDSSHTVLSVDDNNKIYAFHLDDENDIEDSEEPRNVEDAISFLGKYVVA
jgi:hypothetical protein